MQEKTRLYQSWHIDIISKELPDLKDQRTAQNVNSNELGGVKNSDCMLNFSKMNILKQKQIRLINLRSTEN